MEMAKEKYEQALLLADTDEELQINLQLVDILIGTGDFDQAEITLIDALGKARSARDSVAVFNLMQDYYQSTGEMHKALEVLERSTEKTASYYTPNDLNVTRVFNIGPFIQAKEIDRALKLLKELEPQLEPPLDKVLDAGYVQIYAETGETEKALEAAAGVEELAKGFGQESIMAIVYISLGKVYESIEDYVTAIENYQRFLEINPTAYGTHARIARCYRHLKDYRKAKEEILLSLEHLPFSGAANLEAGLIYLESGEEEKGREYLERAVEIWKDADEDYDKANEAKEKLESLKKE
jgi:tetratricopeptide (TPR) repeat protein